METFSDRLKKILKHLGVSQTDLAKKCGVTQQTISYIIKSNINASKLSPAIATSLKINPDWLVYGTGRPDEIKPYEVPIVHSVYMLNKLLNKKLNVSDLDHTFMDLYLGEITFGYLLDANQLLICHDLLPGDESTEYLALEKNIATVSMTKTQKSFAIFERRIRNVDY